MALYLLAIAYILSGAFSTGLNLLVDVVSYLHVLRQDEQRTAKQIEDLTAVMRLAAQRQASGSAENKTSTH